MILTQQISELVEDTFASMSKGQAGTSTTLVEKTQNGLSSAVAVTNLVLIDTTFTSTSISVTHQINAGVGTGEELTEYEVNDGSAISFNRSVKGATTKSATIELTTVHTFNFEIVS